MKRLIAILLASCILHPASLALAQQGTPPTPSALDQTADQLQQQADAAIANAQAAVYAAQSAANAAAQAKVAAAEARQKANALEAQAATVKALEAEQRAGESVTAAQRAVAMAGEALRAASASVVEARQASTSSNFDRMTFVAYLSSKRAEIDGLTASLAAVTQQLAAANAQVANLSVDVAKYRSAFLVLMLVATALASYIVTTFVMGRTRRSASQQPVRSYAPSAVTLDNETGEVAPEAQIVEVSPEMRRHIEGLLSAQ